MRNILIISLSGTGSINQKGVEMIRSFICLQILLVLVLVPACTDGAAAQNSPDNGQGAPLVYTSDGVPLIQNSPGNGQGAPLVYTSDGVTLTMRLEADSIHISISAPTTGWVSVGFEPSRVMKDADIYIGYVQDGVVHLRDDFGTGNTSHAPDTSLGGESSFTNLHGTESDGVTSISFTIPRNSGDGYDKVLTAGRSYKVLLGYGPNGSDDFTTYHRWVKSVDLTL